MGSTSPPTEYAGKFHYIQRDAEPVLVEAEFSMPPLESFGDPIELPVTDLRPSLDLGDASPYKLSVHGFTARRHPSQLHSRPYCRESWNDEQLLRTVYFPEVENLVKRVTGCRRTLITLAVVRSEVYTEDVSKNVSVGEDSFPPIFGRIRGDGKCPAPKVHLDYSAQGARRHIRCHHKELAQAAEPVIQAENELLNSGIQWDQLKDHYHGRGEEKGGIPRFALFSVWRPLSPVFRDPLAIAPCVSFPKSDYIHSPQFERADPAIPPHLSHIIDPSNPTKRATECRVPGSYDSLGYLAHAPYDREGKGHDWHFVSDQQPSDVVIIQLFDNEMESSTTAHQEATDATPGLGVGGALHSAFELTGQNPGAPARESLEVRCAAFW